MLYAFLDYRFCYGVESYTVGFFRWNSESRDKMPCDSFSFAVRVRCKVYSVGVLNFLFEFLDKVAFSSYIYIVCFKIIIYINSEC